MEHYIWIPLIPLTLVLAWQDWKSRQVNFLTALITLVTLLAGIEYFYQSLLVCCILWIYRYFRKNSIQPVDITLSSLGAGYFSIPFLTPYCLITAAVLFILFKCTLNQKLPFVTAWTVGFWTTYFAEKIVN